jgi:hypothetical protein
VSRRPLLLALSFVLASAAGTWLWLAWGGAAYERLLITVAGPLLEGIGVTRVAESPAQKRFISYVPFLVLMWLTPGMTLRRRAAGTLAGCALLFVAHVALVGIEQFSLSKRRPTSDPFSTLFPAALFADSLPFMLWAVIAQRTLRDLFARVLASGARKDAAG